MNKEKSAAFRDTHPIWLHLLDEFRTLDWGKIMDELNELRFLLRIENAPIIVGA